MTKYTQERNTTLNNKDSFNGKESNIKEKSFVNKNIGNVKLKVQFFWPFKDKYLIIDLTNDLSNAVAIHPYKKYLWIISIIPKIDQTVYQNIISRLTENGFDFSKLLLTVQPR
ncbi:MAG: lipocalin family protein [Saprospiraceae bacterium]